MNTHIQSHIEIDLTDEQLANVCGGIERGEHHRDFDDNDRRWHNRDFDDNDRRWHNRDFDDNDRRWHR